MNENKIIAACVARLGKTDKWNRLKTLASEEKKNQLGWKPIKFASFDDAMAAQNTLQRFENLALRSYAGKLSSITKNYLANLEKGDLKLDDEKSFNTAIEHIEQVSLILANRGITWEFEKLETSHDNETRQTDYNLDANYYYLSESWSKFPSGTQFKLYRSNKNKQGNKTAWATPHHLWCKDEETGHLYQIPINVLVPLLDSRGYEKQCNSLVVDALNSWFDD